MERIKSVIFLDEIKTHRFYIEFKTFTKMPKYGLATPWDILFLGLVDTPCTRRKDHCVMYFLRVRLKRKKKDFLTMVQNICL